MPCKFSLPLHALTSYRRAFNLPCHFYAQRPPRISNRRQVSRSPVIVVISIAPVLSESPSPEVLTSLLLPAVMSAPRLLPCCGYARIYPMLSSSLSSCLSVASISSILSSSACHLDQRFLSSQPSCFISCRSHQTVLHPNCGLFFRISFLSSLSSSPSASAMPRQTPLSSMQPNPSPPSSVLLQLSMPHQALSQLPNVVRYPLPTPHNIDLRPPVFYPLSLSPECLPAAS